jgi:hypothetical protein
VDRAPRPAHPHRQSLLLLLAAPHSIFGDTQTPAASKVLETLVPPFSRAAAAPDWVFELY